MSDSSSGIVNSKQKSSKNNHRVPVSTSSLLYGTGVLLRHKSDSLSGSGEQNTTTTTTNIPNPESARTSNNSSTGSYNNKILNATTAVRKNVNEQLLRTRSFNDCDYYQQNDSNFLTSTGSRYRGSYQQQYNDTSYTNEKNKIGSGSNSSSSSSGWNGFLLEGRKSVTLIIRRAFSIFNQRSMSSPSTSSLRYERTSTTDNEYYDDDDENDINDDVLFDDEEGNTIDNNGRNTHVGGRRKSRRLRQQQQQKQTGRIFSNRIESVSIQKQSPTNYCSYKALFYIVSTVLLVLVVQLGLTSVIVTSENMNTKESTTRSSILYSLLSGNLQSTVLKSSKTSCTNDNHLQQNENILLKALADDVDNDNDFVVVVPKETLTAGVVASDQKVCSQLGVSILELGGNAIDAAVTTALCIGVVNPSSSGIGGGGFMLILSDPVIHNDINKELYHDARDIDREPIIQKVHNSTKHIEVIDCREVAPLLSTVDMYINTTQPKSSVLGGLAIAVPGELRGLELAHKRHGKLQWKQLIQPVIDLSSNGIVVSKYLAHAILETSIKYGGDTTRNRHSRRIQSTVQYNESWGLRNFITHGNNWDEPLKEGDVMKNPLLTATLTDVMNNGADALYTGDRANELAKDIQDAGGIVTVDDIVKYKPTIRTPVVSTPDVNGFAIVGVPPPSSGGAVIIGALRFLSGFAQPLSTFADTLSIHRIIESMKHSFGIRMSLSDPAYNVDTVKDAVHDLVYGNYMDELRTLYYNDDTTITSLHHYGGTKWSLLDENEGDNVTVVDAHEGDRRRLQQISKQDRYLKNLKKQKGEQTSQRHRHSRRLYRSHGHLEDSGTSHFSIVDKDGNAVSMTTSINTVFGSMVVGKSNGILLGNTMDDFANPGVQDFFGIKPSEANYIQPGKKPLSSMSPTFVFEQQQQSSLNESTLPTAKQESLGSLILAVGGSGGPKIITAVLQVILNHIYLGKNMLESIIHPRVHNQLIYHGSSVTMVERATLDHIITNIEHDVLIEFSNRTRTALIKRQHQIGTIDYTGCVQGIAIDLDTGTITGASDVRKGGAPAGT